MLNPRIVIIDPAYLGDVVFDGPLVAALCHRFFDATIGIVARPPADAIAARISGVDVVHVFDKRKRDAGWRGLLRMAAELRDAEYTHAYVVHASLRSALLARIARIPIRIGARGLPASWLLTEQKRLAPTLGFVERRLALLDAPSRAVYGTLQRAAPRPQTSGPHVRNIGIALGSAWETKRWSIAQAAEFVCALPSNGTRLVCLGSEDERPLYDALFSRVPAAADEAIMAVGGSVSELIGAIEQCDVVVGGDTGPVHIARGLGIPVVALFGPTDDSMHGFSEHDRVLTALDLPCRPCHAHGQKRCPLRHHRCMQELEGERVAKAVLEVLT